MRRKKTKVRVVWAIILFCLLSVGGIFAVMGYYNSLLGPVSKSEEKIQFEVKPGEPGNQIADGLEEVGLIKSALAFRIYAKNAGISNKFSEGIYYLAPNLGAKAIAQELIKGEKIDVRVTTIEGWRNEEVAEELNKTLGIPKQDFLAAAELGYMFPDTYFLNKKATPADIAATMKENFNKKVSDATRRKIQSKGLTLDEGVTLASIVERESHDSIPNERQMVASVLYKRYKIGMPLQADATVQYALGYSNLQKKWWRVLGVDELQTNSPYNTYTNQGLPPGPISNPGLAAIEAVANITDTPYLFYIHGKDGTVRFAKTLEEHNLNRQKYL